MNIDEILNMIDDMLEEAWSLPFSGGRCVVDAQKVKECVEDIRLNLPGEIKQAKMIVADRNDIIKGAERQAESTLRKAEERARMLIAQEEIVKQAQEKAADIIAQAQMAAKEIRRASHEFSDSILKQTEENLSASLKNVRDTRQALRSATSKTKQMQIPKGTKMAAFLLNTEKGKRYEHNDVKMGGVGADAAGPPGGIFSTERSAVVPVAGQDERAAVFVLSGAGAGKDPKPPALSQKAVDRLGGDGAGQLCADPAVPTGAGGDQQQYFFHHGGHRLHCLDL